MEIIFHVLIASVLVQTPLSIFISHGPHEDTKSLSTTTADLLSSFQNCIVYIFDWAYKSDYDSLASTKYIQFYSKYLNCAVLVETPRQYRNSTFNYRFGHMEPHPLFTKYTRTLLNLYTPYTTSGILNYSIQWFFNVLYFYNIPFNYVLIFMSKAELSYIVNTGLFCELATVSSPAVFLLTLDEQEVNFIGFAHAFQSAPFLFKVLKFDDAHLQQLHQVLHKDLQGAISRYRWADRTWEKCPVLEPITAHPHYCALEVISKNLNTTVLNYRDHSETKLAISEILVQHILTPKIINYLSRNEGFNLNLVSYAVYYQEYNFLCIADASLVGLMAFVKAYDLLTWIVSATACLCLSAAIAVMTTKTRNSFLSRFRSASPVVLMLLIERFYGYGQVIRSASRQIVLVITLWAFGAMLLGMCYSGNMISELASPSLPECPHDMQQLSEIQEYPILTATLIQKTEGMTPYFHDEIENYWREYGHTNGSLLSLLRKLGKKLTSVDYNSPKLIPSNYNTSSKILLAYVGLKEYVLAYGRSTITQSGNLRVLRGSSLPFFNVWTPLAVQTNFLGPILQRLLGNLCKCGIWKLLTESFHAVFVYQGLKTFDKSDQIVSGKEWERKSTLAVIWCNFDPLVAGESPWSGMTLENLHAAFQFFSICMLLGLCVFVKEKRLFQLLVHYLLQVAEDVSIALNRIADNFAMLLRMVVNRATVTVQPEPERI